MDENLKKEIDFWFKKYFKNKGTYNKKIYEAMNYSISVGGKRIRPILMLYTYNMYKDDYKNVLPIACSIEMIHTYSLIHDDLPCMDNDDLRRGKPTNHKIYGDAIATLAGDALLNEAMNIMFDFCITSSQKSIEACHVISRSAGSEGMIAGQVVDILSENKEISSEVLEYMHKKKTGALIKASIISGALLGNAENKDIEKLNLYGEKLGLAFQIKDDLLDVLGNEKLLGKKINSDKNNNKTTFVTKCGIGTCKEKCKLLTKQCLDILNSIERDTTKLQSLTKYLLNREV